MFTRGLVGIILLATALRPFSPPSAWSAEATIASAAGGEKAKPDRGAIVATVNDKQFFYKRDLDRSVDAFLKVQKVDPADLPKLQASVLQEAIDNFLLNNFLLNSKELAPTGAEMNTAMNDARKQLQQQNITMSAYLASQNMNEQALMSQLAWQIMVQKYVALNTTDEGLKKFFEENKQLFDGTVRRVSHVLLRPDGPADDTVYQGLVDQAKSLRDQIQTGQIKFEEAATKYSAGPSRQRGGDLGYVPLAGVMHPNFSKTAYSIKPDEVSEPVGTPFGIHLIKVTEVKAGTKALDDVKPLVQRAYSQQLIEKLKEDQAKAANIVYVGNYPYFKQGTREVVMPGQTPAP